MSMLIIIGLAMFASFAFSLFLFAAFAYTSRHDPEQIDAAHTQGNFTINNLPTHLNKKVSAL